MSRASAAEEEPRRIFGEDEVISSRLKQQKQRQHLERSFTTPLRLKQVGGSPIPSPPGCLTGKKFKSTVGQSHSVGFCPGAHFRRSFRERSFHEQACMQQHQHQHQQQQRRRRQQEALSQPAPATVTAEANKLDRHKSVSPAPQPLCLNSSSASDSALSQSRSTLGSESGRSTGSCSQCSKRACSSDDKASDDRLSSSASSELSYGNPEEHFKIVWHRLTYRVPERRLARLLAGLRRLKQNWLPASGALAANEQEASKADAASNGRANIQAQLESGTLTGGLRQKESLPPVEAVPAEVPNDCEAPGPRRVQRQRQVIFSNLNGCVKSGQLSAILGPSGAGKTTFLKCLTSDITRGVSGSISIHSTTTGAPTSQHLKLCIIPQKDYLFDNLTVMENLLFASRIKNTQRDFDHSENVFRIASLLGLQACLKLKTSRLSGGQSKRVSIAQELLSQPDILILDEPTSGLDSLTCFRTVSVLRELADMSKAGLLPPLAIVMTIHQPQIKIFNLFHHVYIMSSLGSCVYEGRPEFLIGTVADCCKLLPPPDDQNAASFIIELASEVYGPEPIDKLIELQRENFHLLHGCLPSGGGGGGGVEKKEFGAEGLSGQEAINSKVVGPLASALADDGKLHISDQLRKRNNHHQSFWLHTSLLIRRLWISMWRDSLLTTTRVTFHLVIPFIFYFVYSQKSGIANACPHVERELDIQDMVSDSNIQRLTIQHDELILTFENVSLFFLLLYSFSMCVLAVTALSFPLNMQILLKETANGWYTMPRFVMAKTLADLPIELTMPMISVSIAYALTGQPSSYLSWRLLAVTAVMTLCSLISQTQGLLFGAYFMNNVQAAVFVSQASTLPWIMLSGFTTRVSQLPKILQWLSFGSIYRLGIESIVSARYGFGMCPCDEESVNDTPPRIVGIPDQVKSVMSYYMDMYNSSPTTNATASSAGANSFLPLDVIGNATTTATSTDEQSAPSRQVDMFGKLASTLARANTYGADIVSCDDVRPFIMSAREVDESTLPIFVSILVGFLVILKLLLFYVVKIRTG